MRADTLTGELCRLIKRPHIIPMSSLTSDAAATPDLPLLVLVRDLLFSSRITVAAKHLGVGMKLVREPGQLAAEAGGRLIVDLNQPGALDAAAEWRRSGEREVVGFVAHVDADTIRRAREAGIDQVLPRSRFVAELESIIRPGA
jgi:hypothetical protein